MKNGRAGTRGICVECGTSMFRMTRPSHWTDESSAVERWKDFRAANFH